MPAQVFHIPQHEADPTFLQAQSLENGSRPLWLADHSVNPVRFIFVIPQENGFVDVYTGQVDEMPKDADNVELAATYFDMTLASAGELKSRLAPGQKPHKDRYMDVDGF